VLQLTGPQLTTLAQFYEETFAGDTGACSYAALQYHNSHSLVLDAA
jgi:hypothetical protein